MSSSQSQYCSEKGCRAISKAEAVIFLDLVFTILLISFGAVQGNPSGSSLLTAIQTLPQPLLAPLPSFQPGSWNPLSGIVQATAYIGWAIINLPVIFGYIVIETILFVNLVLTLAFSPAFRSQGIPYLGFIFLGLQVYIVWEGVRTIRGSSVGV